MKRIQFSREINLFKPAAHYYAGVDYIISDETYRDFVNDHTYNGFEYIANVEDYTPTNWQYPQEASELLVYITGSLGDALWHTALVRAIKKRMPHLQIDVAVDPRHTSVWFNNKDIRSIKIEPFVASSLECYDAHVILDEAVAKRTDINQPNCYQILFEAAGLPSITEEAFPHLRLTQDDEARAINTLVDLHNKRDRHWFMLLGLHSSSQARDISPHQWFEIASRFVEKYKDLEDFAIYGLSNNDKVATEVHPLLQQIPNYHPMHGVLDVRGLAALMRMHGCMGIVSVDTAHLHLAAAVNCPTVAIMSTVPGYHRVSTYRFAKSIDNHHACPHAPCFWKRDTFRYHKGPEIEIAPCFKPERTQCEVTKALKVKQVEEAWNIVSSRRQAFDNYEVEEL